MTVIVGMVHEGQVWMGADRRGTWGGGAYYTLGEPKLRRHGPWMIGYAGNLAVVNVLMLIDWEEALGNDPVRGWPEFIPLALTMLEDRKLAIRESEGTNLVGRTNVLIGGNGSLYEISGALEISRQNGMASIGTGCDMALGALWALGKIGGPSEFALAIALRAACAFTSDCGPPFDVWSESGFAETVEA